MSDIPLDGHHIREYLIEVANVLRRDGPQHTVVLVGGALLALHGLRDSTADVDSARGLEDELVAAVAEVANRHDLAPMWLNSTARAFLPATFDESECELLLDHQRLRVLGAPFAQVFLMKLYAGRAQDHDDMIRLWPRTGFESSEDAHRGFWEAYPHAPDDPWLLDYIRQIAQSGGGSADT